MEEKIEKEDIEKILKEIKLRINSEGDLKGIIEKHPIPALVAAFGLGVVLSMLDDYVGENIGKTSGNSQIIDGVMKVALPLIMKKMMV
ncbi:MAG TPA: hypothetical protein PLO36_00095 [Methanofastidiosum sp.]|nr:hypothetical protein [Methanofastidiosum sp.]HPA48521.1 hypothetical protein [Methanofastidiosum sp.]HQK62786.1 hypothetical protein [Methanofastidiosum sp.]HQM94510.1 hypothetical protein [Methanofastidiosum sp.]HQQ48859.1 hypothetical protein [Methanofastidiosum sp.]